LIHFYKRVKERIITSVKVKPCYARSIKVSSKISWKLS